MTTINGCFGLTLAHELEHGKKRIQLWAGDLLLLWIGLPFFKDDHLFGHHHKVGTAQDLTSGKLNQSFYQFIGAAFWERMKLSYLKGQGLPEHCWKKNLRFALATGGFVLALCLIHPALMAYWLAQALGVYFQYELANYIQHYGLTRQSHEPIALHHSWNCYHPYVNCMFFMLPAHSAHHVGKPLEDMPQLKGPRLPYGFMGSMILALIPRLWFMAMNPAVERVSHQFAYHSTDMEPKSIASKMEIKTRSKHPRKVSDTFEVSDT